MTSTPDPEAAALPNSAGALDELLASPALLDVAAERARQTAQWGQNDHPDGTGGTAAARIAEGCKQRTDAAATNGTITWNDILAEEFWEALAEEDPARLRAELVQVAAVATQWVDAIDRRTGTATAVPAADPDTYRQAGRWRVTEHRDGWYVEDRGTDLMPQDGQAMAIAQALDDACPDGADIGGPTAAHWHYQGDGTHGRWGRSCTSSACHDAVGKGLVAMTPPATGPAGEASGA